MQSKEGKFHSKCKKRLDLLTMDVLNGFYSICLCSAARALEAALYVRK